MSEQDWGLDQELDNELPKGNLPCGSTFWVSTATPEAFDAAGFEAFKYEFVGVYDNGFTGV